MVIFGAAGDLTKRLLMPALYNLAHSKLLAEKFVIVGFARTQMSTEDFCTKLSQEIQDFVQNIDKGIWDDLVQRIHYISGNFDDADAYQQLVEQLKTSTNRTEQTATISGLTQSH
jgi:glucose-6-phosphate 1-dehydrogenase